MKQKQKKNEEESNVRNSKRKIKQNKRLKLQTCIILSKRFVQKQRKLRQ